MTLKAKKLDNHFKITKLVRQIFHSLAFNYHLHKCSIILEQYDSLVKCVTRELASLPANLRQFKTRQFNVAYTTTFLRSRHVKLKRPTLLNRRLTQLGRFVTIPKRIPEPDKNTKCISSKYT